jgi:phage-related protein
MPNSLKAPEAARHLGRNGGKARAKSVDEKQRIAWSKKGGKAAQVKLTPAERSRRAKLRWQRWREKKTTNRGERK